MAEEVKQVCEAVMAGSHECRCSRSVLLEPPGWKEVCVLVLCLRWRASNNTQPCNNWRRDFRFSALSTPAEVVEVIHGVMPPVLFQGFSWPFIDQRSKLSATLYVLRTMTKPTATLGEIPCYFSVRFKYQLNDFCRSGLRIQLLH